MRLDRVMQWKNSEFLTLIELVERTLGIGCK